MTAGQHYWEVEILGTGFAYWETTPEVMFGAVRPSAAAAGCGAVVAPKGDDAFLVDGKDGGLWGQGFAGSAGDARGVFKKGDKIGTFLDLDHGVIRFYRNGVGLGLGFRKGVTGPLLRAVQMDYPGMKVAVVPGAVVPGGPDHTTTQH